MDDEAKVIEIANDLGRIKRDIAETAARHGFAELKFQIDWGDGAQLPDEPQVRVKTVLF